MQNPNDSIGDKIERLRRQLQANAAAPAPLTEAETTALLVQAFAKSVDRLIEDLQDVRDLAVELHRRLTDAP